MHSAALFMCLATRRARRRATARENMPLFPAGAIVTLIVGVNLLGDGLREWLMARQSANE